MRTSEVSTDIDSADGTDKLPRSAIFQSLAALAIFSSLGLYVFTRISGVLPTVFGDELVYQRASYSQGASSYLGNGLFSALYGLTASYGLDSYQYVKFINVLFLVGVGFSVYLYSRQSLDFVWALAFGAASIVGPLSVYASFFMPEVMFSFLISLFLGLFALFWSKSGTKMSWGWLLAASLVLAAASAVKPHALFLAPIALVFISVRSGAVGKRFLELLAFTVVLVVGNVLVTQLLGPEGASPLFGDYFGGAVSFLGNSAWPEILDSPGAPDGVEANTASSSLLVLAGSQVLLNLFASLAFVGLPVGVLLASVFVLRNSASFSLIALAFLITVVAAFTVYVTLTGDDHSDRVLLRYYEWLFLFIYIDAASTLLSMKNRETRFDAVVFAFGIIQVGSIWAIQGLEIDFQVSDSIFLAGLGLNLDSPYALSGIIIIGFYLLIRRLIRPHVVVTSVAFLGFFVLGFSSQQSQIDMNSKISGSDLAGIFLYENPELLATRAGAIVGADRTLNQAVRFWSREYDLELYTVAPESPIEVSDNESPKVVVALDSVTLNTSKRVKVIHEGNNFTIYEILE